MYQFGIIAYIALQLSHLQNMKYFLSPLHINQTWYPRAIFSRASFGRNSYNSTAARNRTGELEAMESEEKVVGRVEQWEKPPKKDWSYV